MGAGQAIVIVYYHMIFWYLITLLFCTVNPVVYVAKKIMPFCFFD